MRSLPRILIVEDESAIAELISVNLRHNGFQPVWAMDAESAQRELDEVLPDVILLDWMLPGESGLTLARRWRAATRTKAVPILMLTARGDEADRVAGLDAGADDYIVKPFSPRELLARMSVVLSHAPRGGSKLAVLFADLDGLKEVNDTFGHGVGDEVIVGETPTSGVIESMDARRTRLRDDNGVLHVIPNSVVERKEWILLR